MVEVDPDIEEYYWVEDNGSVNIPLNSFDQHIK